MKPPQDGKLPSNVRPPQYLHLTLSGTGMTPGMYQPSMPQVPKSLPESNGKTSVICNFVLFLSFSTSPLLHCLGIVALKLNPKALRYI